MMKIRYTGERDIEGFPRRSVIAGRDSSDRVIDLRGTLSGSLYTINTRGRALAFLVNQDTTPFVFNYPNLTFVNLEFSEVRVVNNQGQYIQKSLQDLVPSDAYGIRHRFSVREVLWGVKDVKIFMLFGWVKDRYELIFYLSEDFGLPERASGIFEFYACPVIDVAASEIPFLGFNVTMRNLNIPYIKSFS
ncbi:MAG: hypothetical protein N2254_07645, partial [bacterium]|nr:hypothetical protein [bacterium]